MATPDVPDDFPAPPRLPDLVEDYRAQHGTWAAQARELARLRQEVLAAADSEAREIVTAARAEVTQILLKARRELLVLSAQVKATEPRPLPPLDTPGESGDLAGTLHDLSAAHQAFAAARRDVRHVLEEAQPDLAALSAEADALRSSLRPPGLRDTPPARAVVPETIVGRAVHDTPTSPRPRQGRALVAALAVIAVTVVAGASWWYSAGTRDDGRSGEAAVPATASGPPAAGTVVEALEASPAEVAQPEAGLSIDLETHRPVWMRVLVDGRLVTERLFEAGERQQIAGAETASIRAGDAGAVFVSVNRGEAAALGRDGQPLTRHFAADSASGTAGDTSAPGPGAAPPETATPATTGVAVSPGNREPERPGAVPAESPAPLVNRAPPTVAQAPAAAAAPAPASDSPPAPPQTIGPASLRDVLLDAAGRWFDAYHRQDLGALGAFSSRPVLVADERGEDERVPYGVPGVRRVFEDPNAQVFGDNAMFTARVVERVEDRPGGRLVSSTAYVAQMWVWRGDSWELEDVRIVSASSLARPLR